MGLVFLGGSCNPTTWRTDIVIPALEHWGITYYNPQTDEWKPELIEIENEAKAKSRALFFTIDNETRSVVSIIECAYLTGCRRNLIIVMQDLEESQEILKEHISSREFTDIRCGHVHLRDLTDRESIEVFSSISKALIALNLMVLRINSNSNLVNEQPLTDDSSDQDTYILNDRALVLMYESIRLRHTKEHKESDDNDENHIKDEDRPKIKDIVTILEFLSSEKNINYKIFNTVINEVMEESSTKPTSELLPKTVQWNQFSNIIKLYTYKCSQLGGSSSCAYIFNKIQSDIVDPLFKNSEVELDKSSALDLESFLDEKCPLIIQKKKVYLGGSCDKTKWRDRIAVPTLKNNGITFFDPVNTCWSERLIRTELEIMDSCDILLFVITGETRSLAAMTLAAYAIGKKRNVTICIQDLAKNCLVAGETLSEIAVRDYNRGRAYLRDMALQNGLIVHDRAEDAMAEVIYKCR